MRMRWRGLELPSNLVLDKASATEAYGSFSIEPFERGFGTTVGNSLRRILLSSLEGSAITKIKISGAEHEFMALPGVYQDVTDIVLNLKSLIVHLDSIEPQVMTISVNKAGVITASNIEHGPNIKIINVDHEICTLTEDIEFNIEMTVEKGRGFVAAIEHPGATENEHGTIWIDSIFSPVLRTRYKTDDCRVGQKIDYDKLTIEVWTDETITPDMALVEAAKIMRKHLGPFVNYYELGEDTALVENLEGAELAPEDDIDEELKAQLVTSVTELELSVRANNCLELAQINQVWQLVRLTDNEVLSLRSFGKTSLREIKRKLAEMGLGLGMDVPDLS